MDKNIIRNAVLGVAVGDALGVPVEFSSPERRIQNPVDGMWEYGTYDQPRGTWSDDTSMTLALMDGLAASGNIPDYKQIMDNYVAWHDNQKYTATDELFDIGNACFRAILEYSKYGDPINCGDKSEFACGNGALMRIIPALFWLINKYGCDFIENPQARDVIHNLTSQTHGNERCLVANGFYLSIASEIYRGSEIKTAVRDGIKRAYNVYKDDSLLSKELRHFERIMRPEFENRTSADFNNGGYVIDTLESAVWALLTTNNYRDCVLKVVNLGNDTDTAGAVAGGLAGMYYGIGRDEKSIPKIWLKQTLRTKVIEEICDRFSKSLK